jgi:LysR family transcriptional regulator, nitrogen assimilation regulatory protein
MRKTGSTFPHDALKQGKEGFGGGLDWPAGSSGDAPGSGAAGGASGFHGAVTGWEAAINLRQLRYFVRVIEVGNITRAAEQLNVAQPALGLQIRQLEQELGVDLLVRHSRGVLPTEAGRLLFDRANGILHLVQETEQEVKSLGTVEREVVSLGLTPSIMLQLGPDLLLDARESMPGVFLSLSEELSFVLVDALERGEIDLAFAYEVGERPGLTRQPLLDEELIYVTSPAQAPGSRTVTFTEALGRDLVLAGEKDSIRRIVQAAAERMALQVRVPFEAQSVSAMKAVVARGAAASIMPYGTAIEELERGVLVGCRISEPSITRTLYLVRSNKRVASKHEDAIEQFLKRVEQRLLVSLKELAKPAPEPVQ